MSQVLESRVIIKWLFRRFPVTENPVFRALTQNLGTGKIDCPGVALNGAGIYSPTAQEFVRIS
jgi:hypothetical protein